MAENNISMKEIFDTLSKVNFQGKIKQKIGLSYVPWATAWNELKKYYPDSDMKIYTRNVKTTRTKVSTAENETITTVEEEENELPYFTDGKTCYVKVGIIIGDIEYAEILPVMDNRNNAVPLSVVTMTAVNKSLQRCFVKAAARFGLGLFLYEGEDLPESERKVIDFKAIADNCDRYQTTALSEDGFATLLKATIDLVQAEYPTEVSAAIIEYVQKQTAGKRLSLFTNPDDAVKLQRINNFINEVKKQLAAPNGR